MRRRKSSRCPSSTVASFANQKRNFMEPEQFLKTFKRLESEVGKVIVGHDDVIRKVLVAFFAGGHIFFESGPGLGKTLFGKSLRHALGMTLKRTQFNPY